MSKKEALIRHEQLVAERQIADTLDTINEHVHGKFLKQEIAKLIEANARQYIRINATHKDSLIELVELQAREQTLREIVELLDNAKNIRQKLDNDIQDVIEFLRMIEEGPEDIALRQPYQISTGENDE
jgi:hypothetical protein